MRGKVACADQTIQPDGITPAWAGKRSPLTASKPTFWDHPRMGGEKYDCTGQEFTNWGSPPRRRGKGKAEVEAKIKERITPAWAGKSRTSTGSCHFWEDHPRMGGEKPVAMHSLTTKAGSPPRGRGKGCRIHSGIKPPRITPAWAGKSRKQQRKNRWKQDHPRMGGEKISTHCSQWSSVGSPPHGRGKASLCWFCFSVECITPAWAGKSMEAGREAP